MASPAAREPGPLVTLVLSLTVEKVDSIGFEVLRCTQCSAWKSKKHSNGSRSSRSFSAALRPLRVELVVECLGGVADMFAVLGVSHLGEHLLRERLDGLGQSIKDVRGLVHPTPLLFGLGEHVTKCRPEPECTVANSDDRCPHVAVTQVPEQCRPGVGGLPVVVRDRDELLFAVEAHPDDHETAEPFLLEAHVEVDPSAQRYT